jgi:hypothetical protein
MLEKIRQEIENLLYPELRPYRGNDRIRLLRKAAETPFDFIEWLGILAALVFVISLTRYGVADFGIVDRIIAGLVNFLVAIPLLGVTAGPFLVRRTRRGLHSQLH